DYAQWRGFHPDGTPYLPEEWPLARAILHGETVTDEEIRIERLDGSELTLAVYSTPVREHGRIVAGVAAFFDLTERKRAQQSLRDSAAQLRLMTELIPQQVWTALPDRTIDYCNPRCYEYVGAGAGDLLGDGWLHVVHPDDIENAYRKWEDAVASGSEYKLQ